MTDDRFLLDRRYTAALDSFDDDSLAALVRALDGDLRDGFARVVGLPANALDEGQPLGSLVREGIARRKVAHDAGILLAEPCTQWSIEKLGNASEDPTLEELREMLPEAIEKFGLDAVRLMVIQYSRSLKGFRQLIASDERFSVAAPAPGGAVLVKDEAVQAAKRAARKERKAAQKAVRAKQQRR